MALKPVGGLWKKANNKGEYLAGEIDAGLLGKIPVIIFPNNKKEGNQPDYRLFLILGDKKEEEAPF